MHTCNFVSDQLGRFHLSDAAEEAPQLVLRHALRQVVHYQVGLGVLRFLPSHVVLITVRHVVNLLQVSQVRQNTKRDKHKGKAELERRQVTV